MAHYLGSLEGVGTVTVGGSSAGRVNYQIDIYKNGRSMFGRGTISGNIGRLGIRSHSNGILELENEGSVKIHWPAPSVGVDFIAHIETSGPIPGF